MRRRECILCAAATMVGCSEAPVETRSADEVKEDAEPIPHDSLLREPDTHKGRAVVFEDASPVRFLSNAENRQRVLLAIPDEDEFGSKGLLGNWSDEPRLRENDDITLWGTFVGLYVFENPRGETATPEIDIADVKLNN